MSSTEPQIITFAIDAGEDGTAKWLATQRFITGGSDTPSNVCFEPRLRDNVTYQREAACVVWGNEEARGNLGAVDIDNTDGELDPWLSETWRDRAGTFRRGLESVQYSSHDHIAHVVIDNITTPDRHTIRLHLRDKGALLDIALNEFYDTSVVVEALEQEPKPVCIGQCEGVPLVCVDDANLDYDLHDADVTSVDEVTDQGVILTEGTQWEVSTEPTVFGVRRLTNPAGKQVATVVGEPFVDTLTDVVQYVLERSAGRVNPDDVNSTANDALMDATGYELCYYGRDETTISEFLSQLMASYCGWWFFDRNGLLRLGRLERPQSPSILVLDERNLLDDVTFEFDEAKGLSNRWGGVRNWSPHGDGDIAGSVQLDQARVERLKAFHQVALGANTLHAAYAHALNNEAIRTLLATLADAQTEANRVSEIYSVRNGFYNCTAAIEGSLAWELDPGDIVTLQTDRYGLSAGKEFEVVGVQTRLLSSAVKIRLFGEAPDPGDFPTE